MVLKAAPNLIFLDAMGTLFTLKRSVGEIYAAHAHDHGIDVDATILEQAFRQVFKRYHAPVFEPSLSPASRIQCEQQWWYRVVLETFQQGMQTEEFFGFDAFFEQVFAYFGSLDPWVLFPEVRSVLKAWSEAGIELGIISNFDSRLISILHEMEIADYFQSITISAQSGAAKPDPKIFQLALAKHKVAKAIHVGDQWQDDVQGALSAQIKGIWIDRTQPANPPERVASLNQIVWES